MAKVVSGEGSPADVVSVVKTEGLAYLKAAIEASLLTVLSDKKAGAEAKKAVFDILGAIVGDFGAVAVPHVWECLIAGLRAISDKKDEVAASARAFVNEVTPLCGGEMLSKLVPILLTAMAGKEKWQTKELALNLMMEKAAAHPKKMSL